MSIDWVNRPIRRLIFDSGILIFFSVETAADFKIIFRRYRCGLHFVHGLQYSRTWLSFAGIPDFLSSRQPPR